MEALAMKPKNHYCIAQQAGKQKAGRHWKYQHSVDLQRHTGS
jgi:hypothetical protein